MTCYLCKGNYKKSTTTHFVDLKKCMVIVKNVPCWECEQCGDYIVNVVEAKTGRDMDKRSNPK